MFYESMSRYYIKALDTSEAGYALDILTPQRALSFRKECAIYLLKVTVA